MIVKLLMMLYGIWLCNKWIWSCIKLCYCKCSGFLFFCITIKVTGDITLGIPGNISVQILFVIRCIWWHLTTRDNCPIQYIFKALKCLCLLGVKISLFIRGWNVLGYLGVEKEFWFLAFDICRFCVVIRFFIPATTANDLRLRRISIPDLIHYIFNYLNSWKRASISLF